MPTPYPNSARERDRWILSQRSQRPPLDPRRAVGCFVEEERSDSGEVVPVATVFLTNRECPWRCVMCDLWQNTLEESVPAGAIPEQIDRACAEMAAQGLSARQVKLYNSGSFFDRRAIPRDDHPAIAQRLASFDRVIVECHPSLVGPQVLRFRDQLAEVSRQYPPRLPADSLSSLRGRRGPGRGGPLEVVTAPLPSPLPAPPSRGEGEAGGSAKMYHRLEVAMGLETAHPGALERLNKAMTLDDFARTAGFLRQHDITLRVFILVRPPFLPEEAEARCWVERSLDYAFDCGASVASLIPTRGGNGAMEALNAQGLFTPPRLADLEAAAEYGVALQRGRVFADLWDLEKFSQCAACCDARRQRLQRMNLTQQVEPPVRCTACGMPERKSIKE